MTQPRPTLHPFALSTMWMQHRFTAVADFAAAALALGFGGIELSHIVTPAALEAYEAERRPATARIVLANRGNGPEQVMQMVQERAPDGFARIEDVLSPEELEGAAAGYKRIAGFDVGELNARAPIVQQ